jgi:hypothetical protein
MSKLAISKWVGKPNHPRYYITDGREPLGVIFEARGIFSAVDAHGNLVVASTSLKNAADALTPTAVSS